MERGTDRAFWCGVRLDRNPARAVQGWHALVDNAPASASITTQAVHFL
jgi:hypothetical protein